MSVLIAIASSLTGFFGGVIVAGFIARVREKQAHEYLQRLVDYAEPYSHDYDNLIYDVHAFLGEETYDR